MRSRLVIAAVLVAAVVVTVVSLRVSLENARQGATAAEPAPIGLDVRAPDHVEAGAEFEVVVVAPDAIDGTEIRLLLMSSINTHQLVESTQGGRARFVVEPRMTNHAGVTQLVAIAGETVATAETMIEAGPVGEPLVPLVGPRTIIADGRDFSMVVITPVDQFGNPLGDGELIRTSLLRPDGEATTLLTTTDGGIAASLIPSDTVAGRLAVSSRSPGVDGPTTALDQVAGRPEHVIVQAEDRLRLADGFTLHEISTQDLFDEFANPLPDGLDVLFVIDGPNGVSTIESTVQRRAARAQFEAPRRPGIVEVRARVSGRESEPLVLEFLPAVDEIAVSLVNDLRLVDIGPVIITRGGYAPDGTSVEIFLPNETEPITTGALRDGRARVAIPLDIKLRTLEIEILGVRTTVGAEPA